MAWEGGSFPALLLVIPLNCPSVSQAELENERTAQPFAGKLIWCSMKPARPVQRAFLRRTLGTLAEVASEVDRHRQLQQLRAEAFPCSPISCEIYG